MESVKSYMELINKIQDKEKKIELTNNDYYDYKNKIVYI